MEAVLCKTYTTVRVFVVFFKLLTLTISTLTNSLLVDIVVLRHKSEIVLVIFDFVSKARHF